MLIRIICDVFSIFDSDAKIEKLFNQERDIIHYRRNRFHASTIEILMMLRMHIEKKHTATLLNDIIDQNINLNNDLNTKAKTNDQRNQKIYVEAILFNLFEFFSVEIENFTDVEN